jgi:large subunit ribosomal protein L15
MLINELKLNSKKRKRKTIGRGGKKGTYSGKGNKGQKARSGAHVDPLFEGGRSTLIDHLKKKRGFTAIDKKRNTISLSKISKVFDGGAIITIEDLVKNNFFKKAEAKRGVKILGPKIKGKEYSFGKNIFVSKSISKK